MNIHIDTSFPCSLQEPGMRLEGGWSLDFNNEANGCHRADDTEHYAMTFSSQDMHPQVQDVGWFC